MATNSISLGKHLEKARTGIPGLDDITKGGIPRGRTTLVAGGPGTGKTMFALQSLLSAAQNGESCVFVAFEEQSAQIMQNAAGFAWDLRPFTRRTHSQGRVAFLDAQISADVVQAGNFDLQGLLAATGAQVRAIGARRVVFDAIDVLLGLLNDPLLERRELYRLNDWLKANGLTGILTARATPDNGSASRDLNELQFLCDCVLMLNHSISQGVSLRSLRVSKYRGSAFLGNEFPIAFGASGIVVADVGSASKNYKVFKERVSCGVTRLDHMLGGGYFRGSSVLITGAPGTAKTTLAGAFAQSVCQRGERVLMVSFDEDQNEILRNLISVGIDLEPFVRAGQLVIHSPVTESQSAEDHLVAIRQLMEQHNPGALVVDPISAISKAGGQVSAFGVAERLMRLSKTAGVTFLCSCLIESGDASVEQTELQVSTVADTWIHLSYIVQGGERNRALTIVKSRGTAHSNQSRELILSKEGVTLTDVYTVGGQVLMGTARWEKENAQLLEQANGRAQMELKERELALAEAQTKSQIEILQRELEGRRMELSQLRDAQTTGQESRDSNSRNLRRRRGGLRDANGAVPAATSKLTLQESRRRSKNRV